MNESDRVRPLAAVASSSSSRNWASDTDRGNCLVRTANYQRVEIQLHAMTRIRASGSISMSMHLVASPDARMKTKRKSKWLHLLDDWWQAAADEAYTTTIRTRVWLGVNCSDDHFSALVLPLAESMAIANGVIGRTHHQLDALNQTDCHWLALCQAYRVATSRQYRSAAIYNQCTIHSKH